jgi:hypothetical protein
MYRKRNEFAPIRDGAQADAALGAEIAAARVVKPVTGLTQTNNKITKSRLSTNVSSGAAAFSQTGIQD